MRTCGRALLAVVIALSIVGTAVSALGAGPKGLFKVNGHRLFLSCTGSGRPVVVLDAGLDGDHESWPYAARTARRLHTRVCAYDRYGLGRSDGANKKLKVRMIGRAATDLNALLRKAKLKAPYVFAAHSIGGLVDREYARRYPKNVAGMVLLDTAPDDWDLFTGTRTFTFGHESLNVVAASAALRVRDSLGAKPLSSSSRVIPWRFRPGPMAKATFTPIGIRRSVRLPKSRAIRSSSSPSRAITRFR